MSQEREYALSMHKKRGITWASITHLTTHLKDLVTNIDQSTIVNHVQEMHQKLNALDAEFWSHHHSVMDLTDNEGSLTEEQETLDEHDDFIVKFSVHIKQLIALHTSPKFTTCKIVAHRLSHVKVFLSELSAAITALSGGSDDAYLL